MQPDLMAQFRGPPTVEAANPYFNHKAKLMLTMVRFLWLDRFHPHWRLALTFQEACKQHNI